jgi:predicted Zn-ribbon and HTH transcriptional regulator
MKNEITIPILKEEDLIIADERRKKYSLTRDLQAREFNEAIASRLMAKDRNLVKCEKCGKEFDAGITATGILNCPECKQEIKTG